MRTATSLSIKLILLTLTVIALTGCKSSKPAARHQESTVTETYVSGKGLRGVQKSLIEEAFTWEGTPYKYGGAEKGVGVDCSGMVLRVYETVTGKKIPRNSAKQAEFCEPLKPEEVEPGDLVFFATGKDPSAVSHVGLMLDSDRFIHASSTKGVCISDVHSPYYIRTFMMYGRVPR